MKKVFTIFIILLVIVTASYGAKQKKVVKMANLTISSPAFGNNEKVPIRFTGDGDGISPPLKFSNIPDKARSLALTMNDPDARIGTFTHWLVWNITPVAIRIEEGKLPFGSVEGKNSTGRTGYIPPSPPSGTHRYIFRLYALDSILPLKPGADHEALDKAMQGHIVEQAELIGEYR